MDYKVKGIVLSAAMYGEKDKLVTILTDELGKIRMKVRGVRQASAKYKFATQPFAFIECELVKKGEFFTLTSASTLHAFFEILSDYDRMSAGFLVLETADKISYFQKKTSLLSVVLRGLESVSYEKNLCEAKAEFLRDVLIFTGYTLELNNCINCGKKLDEQERMVIDLRGGMKCHECIEQGDKSVLLKTYQLMKQLFLGNESNLGEEGKGVVRLLIKIIEENFSCTLKTS